MSTRPQVVLFDVNETLSDLSPLGARFVEVGAPARLARLWFASVLRDGFALAAAGAMQPFAEIARTNLVGLLGTTPLEVHPDQAAEHILAGFPRLEVHPDVVPAVHALAEAGFRLATLSNGAASIAEELLGAAGVREEFERLLSVEDAGVWKPAAASYRYAVEALGVAAADIALVAVHPWDCDGAARAGLRSVWLNREGGTFPGVFSAPDDTVTSLEELVEVLAGSRVDPLGPGSSPTAVT